MGLVVLGAVSMCIAAIVLCIKLRKTKHPARVARVFAFIALACGLINLFCDFFPFEYDGPGGIDYIGQAIVWGMVYSAMLYSTLAAYICFAIVATVYAVKASKAKGEASFLTEDTVNGEQLQKAIGETGYTCLSVSSEEYKKKGLFGR